MTTNKRFKQQIRARMARTGERYTTARAALLAQRFRDVPPRAHHDQTHALTELLRLAGHDLDEAWLLGLGGGVSVQVHSFAYEGHDPTLYVGTRCNPQYAYDDGFVQRVCGALGLQTEVRQTGGAKTAARHLAAALEDGPVLAWVGREALHGRDAPGGATPWVVLVRDLSEDAAAVVDADAGPMEVPLDRLATARAAVKRAKHRLVSVSGTPVHDDDAVTSSIAHCVADLSGEVVLGGSRKNWGVGALAMLADQVEGRSWATRFAPGRPLVAGLRDLAHWVGHAAGGDGFRGLYAEFLERAGRPEAAAAYRDLATRWRALVALATEAPLVAELARRGRVGPAGGDPLLSRADEVDAAWMDALYGRLATALRELHDAELAALAVLRG
jgi:hypothetical protein